LGLFIVSGVMFLVGVIQTLGYNGTTSLQPVLANEAKWKDFDPKLFSSDQRKGAPFTWAGGKSPRIDDSLVKFDKRLIRVLTYTAKTGDPLCVWNGTHEKLTISVDSPEMSDLITFPGKQQSVSTLYRGTGVRITSADEVKCTIEPRPAAVYTFECPFPRVFDQMTISLLAGQKVDLKDYDKGNCQVICAVDYYPTSSTPPVGTIDIINPDVKTDMLNRLNPSSVQNGRFFLYEELPSKIQRAGIYKTAQLMYEIMKIDDANCDKDTVNTGNERAIPITMIIPQWVQAELKDDWQTMLDLATQQFRFTFQPGSPLAALAADPNLNDKGLQINF